jgi:hypothetical protein
MSRKIQKYKRLNPLHPVINCEIYLDDYSSDVSSPDETLFLKQLIPNLKLKEDY